jgi:hypothetical protein
MSRWNTKIRKSDILEEQKQKRIQTAQIAGLVEGLRAKVDWIEKIKDPILRDKYCAEAMEQGISLGNANKALGILDVMATCSRYTELKDDLQVEADMEREEEVMVQVGDAIFQTTKNILTADSESMLSRMFSPPWLKPQTGEAVRIETPTNSPAIFTHILNYLEAISKKSLNLFPNFDSLNFEDVSQLYHDSSYLGMRRLEIALTVRVFLSEVDIAEKQKSSSQALLAATTTLTSLRKEKENLEKRLAALPDLIQEAEITEEECRRDRLLHETRWTGQAGDEIMINTIDSKWQKCRLVEFEGSLVAWVSARISKGTHIPIPPPAYYHPASSIFTKHTMGAQIFHVDSLLPQILAESLEQHLDILLHEKPLDLHPGSDGHVVDLIHPSLYPYIKGVTQVTDEEALEACAKIEGDYCWLPAEFSVSDNGIVSIDSYINNLDQETHGDLYFDIAQVFQTMLPMFEQTLEQPLRSCPLQVIVKAAYYFIPPGEVYIGSWHVEGMDHEHIVASGIYYISVSSNIDKNHLSFRTLTDEETLYEERGYPGQEVELVNELGSVPTPTGRALVWENNLQHKVGALTVSLGPMTTLNTPTPVTGIRKILCFFLVNPNQRIVSTKIIPPQQNMIPIEVAMGHRQKLMNERKYKAEAESADWEQRTYTFCEH